MGLQDAAENASEVPDGAPETDSDTDWVAPAIRLRAMGYGTDSPAVMLPFVGSDNEKSNGVPPPPAEDVVLKVKFADVAGFPAESLDLTR